MLIRVLRTGICGTDLHIYDWDAWAQRTIPVPLVIGHEFVGEIVEVGANVSDFQPGDLVSGEGHVVCGRCRNCMAGRRHLCAHTQGVGVNRPGAFAEYIALPMTNVWHHWPGIDEDVAAIFDPFGNAVHTALAFPVLGEDVLITGAGPIGCMAAAVVRHAGARHVVVTDVNAYRLRAGRADGRDASRVDPTRARPRRRPARARHDRGLRRRPRDVGQPRGVARHARQHGARRPDRDARHPDRGDRDRLDARSSSTCSRIKGIYGREMYETWYKMTVMLQSGLDISPGHHAPLRPTPSSRRASPSPAPGSPARSILDWTEA